MPLDARGWPFDDEPPDGTVGRILRDPEFRAAVVEVLECEATRACLTPPIGPAGLARLIATPRIKQQLQGLVVATALRGHGG